VGAYNDPLAGIKGPHCGRKGWGKGWGGREEEGKREGRIREGTTYSYNYLYDL